MSDASFSFLDPFPFHSEDDRLFVQEMCAKFPRVKQGFERFSLVDPDQWVKESVAAIHEQIRSGWHRIGVPLEEVQSVADHEATGMKLAFLLASSSHYNPTRIAKMFAVHDLAEGIVGDFTPVDPISKPEKYRLEKITLDLIVSNYPILSEADEMKALWQEFEDGASTDAQLGNDIDGLELVMHAQIYENQYPDLHEQLKGFWSYAEKKLSTPEGKALFAELKNAQPRLHPLKLSGSAHLTFPWPI